MDQYQMKLFANATTNNSATPMVGLPQTSSLMQSSIPFPWKLHEMLGEASSFNFERIVSWLPEENGFRVHHCDKFVENIMPIYFNQTKYKSFQRQLNMWGFERIQTGPFKGGYIHQKFVRGQPSLCRHMKRQKVKGKQSTRPLLGYNGVPPGVTSARYCGTTPGGTAGDSVTPPPATKSSEGVDFFTSSLPSMGSTGPLADLMPSGSRREEQHHTNTLEKQQNTIAAGALLANPHEIECLEFEGRSFFDIVDDKDTTKSYHRTPGAATSHGGGNGMVVSPESRGRRFSLEFLVPTHAL